jgi:cytochrome c
MSFEMNKIIASVLVAAIVAMVAGILADKLVQPQMLAKNAYAIAGVAPPPSKEPAAAAAPAGPEPIGPLLASASADAGKQVTAKCTSCHTFDKGGPNRVGPNLWGVMGEEIAEGHNGYAFSDALKAKKEAWTPEELNEWLADPQHFAKGTKMAFAGLAKVKDRADVIAYLNSLSDNPKPLAAAAPAAPAGTDDGAAAAKGAGNSTDAGAGSGRGSGGAGDSNTKGGANGEVGK